MFRMKINLQGYLKGYFTQPECIAPMNFNRLWDIKSHRKRIMLGSKVVHPEGLFVKHVRGFINAGQLDYE